MLLRLNNLSDLSLCSIPHLSFESSKEKNVLTEYTRHDLRGKEAILKHSEIWMNGFSNLKFPLEMQKQLLNDF